MRMLNRWRVIGVVPVLLLLILVSCATGPSTTSGPSAPREAPTGERPELISQDTWQAKWDNMTKAGRKEGKVVVHATSVGPYVKAATQLLKDKFGLELDIVSRRGGELMTAIMAERRSGLYTVDVLITGLNTYFGQIEPAGIPAPLDQVLVLPDILDPKNWYGGEVHWADKEHKALNMYGYPNAMVAINTQLVNADEIKSYWDITNPKFKGKIIMNDPTIAGTGIKSFSVLGWHILNQDFFRQIAKLEPMITRDQRLQVNWLAQGKYAILLFPRTSDMTEFKDAGAPIAWVLPKEGSYLSRDGGAALVVDKAPHPNAAKVFMNWLFSKEGQSMIPGIHGAQSARVDVPTEGIESVHLRQPGIKYFAGADLKEWIDRDDEFKAAAIEIFGPLLK